MNRTNVTGLLALTAGDAVLAAFAKPADNRALDGMRLGAPAVRSSGPIAFGPDDILFAGDTEGATIHAIRIEDRAPGSDASVDTLDRDLPVSMRRPSNGPANWTRATHAGPKCSQSVFRVPTMP
jgi:hypothetical protein